MGASYRKDGIIFNAKSDDYIAPPTVNNPRKNISKERTESICSDMFYANMQNA